MAMIKILGRLFERHGTNFHPKFASRKIILGRMNASKNPGEAALIGSILVGRPLQRQIHAWPGFKNQKFILLAEAEWKRVQQLLLQGCKAMDYQGQD